MTVVILGITSGNHKICRLYSENEVRLVDSIGPYLLPNSTLSKLAPCFATGSAVKAWQPSAEYSAPPLEERLHASLAIKPAARCIAEPLVTFDYGFIFGIIT